MFISSLNLGGRLLELVLGTRTDDRTSWAMKEVLQQNSTAEDITLLMKSPRGLTSSNFIEWYDDKAWK